jgi:hypothetical protein
VSTPTPHTHRRFSEGEDTVNELRLKRRSKKSQPKPENVDTFAANERKAPVSANFGSFTGQGEMEREREREREREKEQRRGEAHTTGTNIHSTYINIYI